MSGNRTLEIWAQNFSKSSVQRKIDIEFYVQNPTGSQNSENLATKFLNNFGAHITVPRFPELIINLFRLIMGNALPRIPFNEVNLVPGNVLIEIDKKYKNEARSRDTGQSTSLDDLILVSIFLVMFINFTLGKSCSYS